HELYEQWRGGAPHPPPRPPLGSVYKITPGQVPRDYHVHGSSGALAAHAQAVPQTLGTHMSLLNPVYGFIRKDIARKAFPGLYEWAAQESERLGREVVPAVFPGSGPPDKTGSAPTSAHFKDTDWRIQPPERD